MQDLSVYIHWPFCKSKCPYCDFNSHVREKVDQRDWLDAYLKEINYFAKELMGKEINSIFFGGGTPSLMEPYMVAAMIEELERLSLLSGDAEITLEANPTSYETHKFEAFRTAGINRLSIGVQSFNDTSLKFLGREHSADAALEAIDGASKIFDRYSFDLIYALPNQTLDSWQQELEFAMSLAKDHISLYQLTIERGTKFYSMHKNQEFVMPVEDFAASMFELTTKITSKHQFQQYEISNYARPGHESRHNLAYWNYKDFIGIGPGAHSRINGYALMMIHNPENWMTQVYEKNVGLQTNQLLSKQEMIEESVMMHMRLKSGIDRHKFLQKHNLDIDEIANSSAIRELIDQGLLCYDGQHLATTQRGMLLLNQISYKVIERLLACA